MRKSIVAAVLVLMAACGAATIPAPVGVAGSYSLRTVNGVSLPFILSQTGPSLNELVDDVITLSDNGTWTSSGHVRNTVNGQSSTTASTNAGSFTKLGESITLSSLTTGASIGVISNGTLTLGQQGVTYVYVR
jgi:hypothetical protein